MLRIPNEPLPGQIVTAADHAAMVRHVKSITPRSTPGMRVIVGPGGATSRRITSSYYPVAPSPPPSFNWNLKNTTTGTTGQVQLNGGDGYVASLNGRVCNVGAQPNDTQSGMPAKYPQLAITGNGVVYGYAVPATPGTASSLSPTSGTLDLYYAGTLPSLDTANPATYFPFLVATITSWAVDDAGRPSFKVNRAFSVGPSTLIYCIGAIQVY